jgi:lysyl-tRNA synthetase class 2
LGKVFRQNEHGSRHHHEFTMLEWYRIGWDEHQLMEEVVELLQVFFPQTEVKKISYGLLFESVFNINPYMASLNQLREQVDSRIDTASEHLSLNDCLDLLFSHCVEPGLKDITLVYNYPASQAALAQKGRDGQGNPVARRFEVFIDDMELANGYFELTDAEEQSRRFLADLQARSVANRKLYPVDQLFLDALSKGLPICSGVALGVDRLLMKVLDVSTLEQTWALEP